MVGGRRLAIHGSVGRFPGDGEAGLDQRGGPHSPPSRWRRTQRIAPSLQPFSLGAILVETSVHPAVYISLRSAAAIAVATETETISTIRADSPVGRFQVP